MDGGDVFLTYLALGMFILLCFFYACCTNLKEDCSGKKSKEAYSPCMGQDFTNGDLEAGHFEDGGGDNDNGETGGSCTD